MPDALYARAPIETNFDFNWSAAAQTVSKAMALAPADPNMLIAAANLETALGNTDRAIELYRKAVELDPVNAHARSFLAFGLGRDKTLRGSARRIRACGGIESIGSVGACRSRFSLSVAE